MKRAVPTKQSMEAAAMVARFRRLRRMSSPADSTWIGMTTSGRTRGPVRFAQRGIGSQETVQRPFPRPSEVYSSGR
jgi:hypothetical protein